MHYSDGQLVQLGDTVSLWLGNEGTVVCSIDTAEFSPEYPKSEWAHLQRGVLILSSKGGLIHYAEADEDLALIHRK
jgi:hypothetical protein